ncbi:glycosyltransferase family 2 protein [Paenibacillus sp. GCM10027628]|uniref:glycosyltransferase family 2 protein n=1 Tax=Paenibacillus sp. GCM10027628 TaxID=3273413 RepID=UPI00363DD3FC
MTDRKIRVLIGSPIHQKPPVLYKFLTSLLRLKRDKVEFGYLLIDDNTDRQSKEILQQFTGLVSAATVHGSDRQDEYVRNEITHFWNERLIWKVAEFKNAMIRHAIESEYDYLFLVDSDLLLHPGTIDQLIAANKDIVSEVFWTKWQLESEPQPQVWLQDEYKQWEQKRGEQLSEEEITYRYQQFIAQLKIPGVYEVGGLGACTLISRHAMVSGVNFNPIKNLSFWGEDRHFCVRAAAMGIPLFVDTHYPAYHIYRDADLEGADKFLEVTDEDLDQDKEATRIPMPFIKLYQPALTLTMIAKNEANRYLKQVLEEHRKYINQAVIIDDGSTDDTLEVCEHLLKGIPVRLVRNDASKFTNEIELRKQQWEETINVDPDWILSLDADEIFERRFAAEVHQLIGQKDVDLFCFRLYDFWSPTHYREDGYWRSHFSYRPFLVRYRDHMTYQWKETAQHCGRFPENIFELPHRLSPLRLKHFGWMNAEHRLEKYRRYMQFDPDAKYGWKEQYMSILDDNPNLVPWIE